MAPDSALEKSVRAAAKMLRGAKRMTVTSAAGTKLDIDMAGASTVGVWGWTDRPGTLAHWPGGIVVSFPKSGAVNGTLVLDRGDINLTFKRYLEAPVRLTLEADYVTRIEGEGTDAELMRGYLAAWGDKEAYAVSHVGFGLNRKARYEALAMYDRRDTNGTELRAVAGNFLFSTGANEFAGPLHGGAFRHSGHAHDHCGRRHRGLSAPGCCRMCSAEVGLPLPTPEEAWGEAEPKTAADAREGEHHGNAARHAAGAEAGDGRASAHLKPSASSALRPAASRWPRPEARQRAARSAEILAADGRADGEECARQRRRHARQLADRGEERQPDAHILQHVAVLGQHDALAPVARVGRACRASRGRTSTPRRPARSGWRAESAAGRSPAPRGWPCARHRARR